MLVRPLAARLKKTWEKIFLGGLTVFQSHNKDIKLKKCFTLAVPYKNSNFLNKTHTHI